MIDSIFTGITLLSSWAFVLMGSFFIITGTIGFLRMKDFFVKLHAIKIANCYGLTFILIGIAIRYYFEISLIKLSIIIILNLLINITCLHLIGRRAYIDNIDVNFKKRKDDRDKEDKEGRTFEKGPKTEGPHRRGASGGRGSGQSQKEIQPER